MPLIFFDGGWGYYDHHHEWHRAPDAIGHHLDQQRAAGGFHPGGAPGYAQPGGRPPGAGAPPGGQNYFHTTEPGRTSATGASPGQSYFHTTEPGRPPGAPTPAAAPGGYFHATEPPRPQATPAAPRPVAQPQHEDRGQRHECPPGQRC